MFSAHRDLPCLVSGLSGLGPGCVPCSCEALFPLGWSERVSGAQGQVGTQAGVSPCKGMPEPTGRLHRGHGKVAIHSPTRAPQPQAGSLLQSAETEVLPHSRGVQLARHRAWPRQQPQGQGGGGGAERPALPPVGATGGYAALRPGPPASDVTHSKPTCASRRLPRGAPASLRRRRAPLQPVGKPAFPWVAGGVFKPREPDSSSKAAETGSFRPRLKPNCPAPQSRAAPGAELQVWLGRQGF